MEIVVLVNAVTPDASAAERDVLVQADSVTTALQELGHRCHTLAVTLDLSALEHRLSAQRPDLVFNLVESLGGTDRLAAAVPALLDVLGIPCTGGDADAMFITCSKQLTKQRLLAAGVPTPAAWYGPRCAGAFTAATATPFASGNYLLKAVHEHASFGMDDDAVVMADSLAALTAAINERAQRFGRPFFAEQFIAGREFNLSLLERDDGTPQVLPPAEIVFHGFPAGKPQIVGYAAKWDEGSFEYTATPRTFKFPPSDQPLLSCLGNLAVASWDALGLRGYGRIDFRVAAAGQPWVIEGNANPCLSPDAGFAAAVWQAELSYAEAIARIVASAAA